MGFAVARRSWPRHGRCIDLRTRPGGTESGALRAAVLRARAGGLMSIRFLLDGVAVEARPGETILQAAERYGARIPHLCYTEGMRADGNCRACVVEIKGERVLAPSCARRPADGMEVFSTNERARHSQKLVLELLMADAGSSAELRSD